MKKTFFLFCAMFTVSCAYAFSPDIATIESQWVETKYPPGSIHDVEQAQAALDEISRARDYSERLSAYSKRHCSRNFFVNRCIDKVRQARLRAERRFLAVEVEAKKIVRDAKKTKAAKRQADRDTRHAAGPKNPLPTHKPRQHSEGMPGVTEHAAERAAQTERRQRELEQKQSEEAKHEQAYAQKLKDREARAKQREASLKKRAAKKEKREREQEAAKKNANDKKP